MALEQLENGDSLEFSMDRGWGFSPSSSPKAFVSTSCWGSWNACDDDSSRVQESVDDGWCSSKVHSDRDYSQISDSVDDGWGSLDESNAEFDDPSDHTNTDSKCPGLLNLGNTCFLNSVLQCLTYTVPLANATVTIQHMSSCQIQGFCAICALADHFKLVLSAPGQTISPTYLADNINEISKSFFPGEQQDAHECFLYLIEALQKCNAQHLGEGKRLVPDLFMGKMRSQLRCNSCSHTSDSVEDFLGLSLEVENCCSVNDALSNFVAVEELEEENKVSCTNCKQNASRSKQLSFDKSPEVLVIQLKRFKASALFPTKIDKDINYEISLDLMPFRSKKCESEVLEGDWKYRLYAVIVHSGWSTSSGHYYCYVQTSPGSWHWMNDSLVSRVNEDTVLRQEAYMLFYTRVGELPQHQLCSDDYAGSPTPKYQVSEHDSYLLVSPTLVDTSSSIEETTVENIRTETEPVVVADMSSNTDRLQIVDGVMTDHLSTVKPSVSFQQAPVEIEVDGPLQDASPVLSDCVSVVMCSNTVETNTEGFSLQQVPEEMELADPVTCNEAYETCSPDISKSIPASDNVYLQTQNPSITSDALPPFNGSSFNAEEACSQKYIETDTSSSLQEIPTDFQIDSTGNCIISDSSDVIDRPPERNRSSAQQENPQSCQIGNSMVSDSNEDKHAATLKQNHFLRLLNTMPSKRRQAFANVLNNNEPVKQGSLKAASTTKQNHNQELTDKHWLESSHAVNSRNKLQRVGGNRVTASLL